VTNPGTGRLRTAPAARPLTPGHHAGRPGQYAHVCQPRGAAPGLTHPDRHAPAIRATVKRPCAPADGTQGLRRFVNGVPSDTVRSCGWVNPGADGRGLTVTNPGTGRLRTAPAARPLTPGHHAGRPASTLTFANPGARPRG